jgi:hypothetical protein
MKQATSLVKFQCVAIDHRDLGKRESLQTLKILTLSILTSGCRGAAV